MMYIKVVISVLLIQKTTFEKLSGLLELFKGKYGSITTSFDFVQMGNLRMKKAVEKIYDIMQEAYPE